MTKKIRVQSNFAILDVKRGHKTLTKELNKGNAVEVVVTGNLVGEYGSFDGMSVEFEIDVGSVECVLVKQ